MLLAAHALAGCGGKKTQDQSSSPMASAGAASEPGAGGAGEPGGENAGGGAGAAPEPVHFERIEVYGVTYAFDRFVAVGVHSTEANHAGVVMTSSDGELWQEQVNEPDVPYWDVLFGNGRVVVIGGGLTDSPMGFVGTGRAVVSSDGDSWQSVDLPDAPASFHAAFGSELFMATAGSSTLASSDGLEWSVASDGPGLNGGIEFAAGRFLRWQASPPAISAWGDTDAWLPLDAFEMAPAAGYNFIASLRAVGDHGEALLVGGDNCDEGCDQTRWALVTSTDGLNWTFPDLPSTQPPLQVLFENDTACVALQPPAPGVAEVLLSGPDCDSLSEAYRGQSIWINAVAEHDGLYVIGTMGGVLVSDDGLSWRHNGMLP